MILPEDKLSLLKYISFKLREPSPEIQRMFAMIGLREKIHQENKINMLYFSSSERQSTQMKILQTSSNMYLLSKMS